VLCHNWIKDKLVLIGDAAHTAHYSIGSGTKLGLEDAICLARNMNSGKPVRESLQAYQDERELEALKLQSAARNSMSWFENAPRYIENFNMKQFTYSLLTRSQRVSHENLRLRDPEWLEGVEAGFAGRACGKPVSAPVPPMFTPFKLRQMTLHNRVVVSPMSMYSAQDGMPSDWHLVHYGSLAMGGAALVYTEMTDISPEGRITPGCAGIWNEDQQAFWQRIVDFVHCHTAAKFCLQLGHSGPKGSTQLGWEAMDQPLAEGNWEIIGPSPVPYSPANQVPRAMTRADMDKVLSDYEAAARRAEAAGFDMLELHCAHGYLLSAFITPVLNKRRDEYGGSLENRLRYPLEVCRMLRAVWPEPKPLAVRISANDWVGDAGVTPAEAVLIAKAFADAGADIIDVSAGQTTPDAEPIYGRMFQTPFADQIRNEAGIPTMAVGNIYEIDHVNSIIAAGRADLCCLARPHLVDRYWTLRAAAQQAYHGAGVRCPRQYLNGFEQLERNLKRAAEMALNA
jgi:anthraniloyl-CoA monooxygenase